jgi:hypothetical protein
MNFLLRTFDFSFSQSRTFEFCIEVITLTIVDNSIDRCINSLARFTRWWSLLYTVNLVLGRKLAVEDCFLVGEELKPNCGPFGVWRNWHGNWSSPNIFAALFPGRHVISSTVVGQFKMKIIRDYRSAFPHGIRRRPQLYQSSSFLQMRNHLS